MLAEVCLGKGSKSIDWVQDFAIFIVKSYFFVDGTIVVGVRSATKNSEIWLIILINLFGLQLVIVQLELEIIQEDDVTNFKVEGKIFFLVAPDVDLEGFILVGSVDDFEFLGEVSVLFVSVGTWCVDDESDGGVELVLLSRLLIFFMFFSGLQEGENLPVFVHNSWEIYCKWIWAGH